MKKIIIKVYARAFAGKIKYAVSISLLLSIMHTAIAQENQKAKKELHVCDVSNGEMAEVEQQVQMNISKLRKEAKLNFKKYKGAVEPGANASASALTGNILFRWPMTTAAYRDFASWHIINFVDLDADSFNDGTDYNPDEIGDYNCGDRTYDGHQAIDIGIDPYRWDLKNNGFIRVVAAADGIIVFKHQGEFDENCGNLDDYQGSTARGNNLVILHDDGSTASFYMHMKDGSLTSKEEGDIISAGDYIGTVASSGRSSEPHLHFQVNTGYIDSANGNDESGSRIDPFVGTTCTESAATSWLTQLPYNDPAVLTLETHGAAPGLYVDACDLTVTLDYDNSFSSNQTIWFRSKFRDWVDGSTVTHNIYKPDGSLWKSYTRTNSTGSRAYFPADQSYLVSAFQSAGTYRYTVTFGGKTYSHYFSIGCQNSLGLSGAMSGDKGYMVSDFISSFQSIGGTSTNYIKYMADGHVTLSPGFRATAGCRFVANTEGCNNSTKKYAKNSAAEVTEEQAKRTVINSVDKSKNLSVYPNPSTGVFFVRYKSEKLFNATIVVRNTFGQIVYQGQTQKNILELQQTINLAGKPKGVYIMELNTGDKKLTGKVVLQ